MAKATDNFQVTAFEGGALRRLSGRGDSREAVLALPLNRLLMKVLKVPAEADPNEEAAKALQAMSPFPDETLTVGLETVREDGGCKVVLAAALPESAADDIGEALDAEKLNVVRVDSLALGLLRGVWPSLGETTGRKIVLMPTADCTTIVVLDGDQPSAIRAASGEADLRREVMLSLLEAEDFGGAAKLDEIVVVKTPADETPATEPSADETPSEDPFAALTAFAPVRTLEVGEDAALVGVAERAADAASLNALPDSWREFLEETRFKAKMVKSLAVAGGIWLLIVSVMFAVPIAYGFMTDHQKSLSKRHQRQYQAVKEMKAKVDLVRKYSDHARGALEIMKAVSDRLPEGITLSSWTYKREDGVHIAGDAETSEATYALKDAMDAMCEGEDGERIFADVSLNGPTASKGGYRFDLDCQYQKEEE